MGILDAALQLEPGGGAVSPVRRRRSLACALAALCKGVNMNWTWRFGVAQSFLMYALTHSDLALQVLAATGHGAPVKAPQKVLYPQVMRLLSHPDSVVEVADSVDVCFYFDNRQTVGHGTSRMRVDGYGVVVTTAIEAFLLVADEQGERPHRAHPAAVRDVCQGHIAHTCN